MERKSFESIESFVKQTDFMAKLRAALETLEQGNAYKAFEGLQKDGSCGVCIHYEGEIVTLAGLVPEIQAQVEVHEKVSQTTEKPETTRKAKTK